jgi:hypothetical protein
LLRYLQKKKKKKGDSFADKLLARGQLVNVRATVNREGRVSLSHHLSYNVAQKQPLGEEKGVELVVALADVRPMCVRNPRVG